MAGFELQQRYGKALDKIVMTVKTEVLPALLPRSTVSRRGYGSGLFAGWEGFGMTAS